MKVAMKFSKIILATSFLLTAGCTVSAPVTGRFANGSPLEGVATGSINGEGTVQVRGVGLECNGTYNALSSARSLTVPLTCSDGATGLAQVDRDESLAAGSGTFDLSNGQSGVFSFALE